MVITSSYCKPLSAKADSFSLPSTTRGRREVWLVYGSPTTDVGRSDDISGRGETARYTGEKGLRRSVMFINTTTYRASSGGISGVNNFDNHPCESTFVGEKLAELVERPRVLLSPLTPPNRDSVSDTAQIFKGDTSSSVFSLCNNPLANCVIDICIQNVII